ncbi:MAG: FHA domain-containing protein [Propionibacteriales bacterium]|nr:FHA domain-containing protein [Propionibacteriales bacterium]
MSELTLALIKIGFLALLWLFVLSSVSVIRSDMFGERVDQSGTATAKPGKPAKAVKPGKKRRGAPTRLVISEGTNAGVAVPLGQDPILLGRGADATIRLDDDYVSTRHARFVPHGEDWYIEDLGSTNGTYIGSQRITTPMVVATGVQVRLGKTIAELKK